MHDLSTHVRLNEDGLSAVSSKIHSKLYRSSNDEVFSILRYDKDLLTREECDTLGLFRSVVAKRGKIVSFSPPKSQAYEVMSKKILDPSVVVQELVEGTMINVFWNPTLDSQGEYVLGEKTETNKLGIEGEWELATRSTVGGRVSYFQDDGAATFRHMFLEATNECGLDLDELAVSDSKGTFCYSIVLGHPKNRLVSLIDAPRLHLVAVYQINGMQVTPMALSDMKLLAIVGKTHVLCPEEYDNIDVTWDSVTKSCRDMSMPYDKPGLVFHDTRTGQRAKFRNKYYEQIKALRGNEPKLQFHYLKLRKEGKVKEFLRYFPDRAPELARYRGAVHNFTKALYENYKSCYIKKTGALTSFPKQFQPHMYLLHQLYIKELRAEKKFVGLPVVVRYVNDMTPAHLMYALNYGMRQRHAERKNKELAKKPSPVPDEDKSSDQSMEEGEENLLADDSTDNGL
jgi:hypothetical protein